MYRKLSASVLLFVALASCQKEEIQKREPAVPQSNALAGAAGASTITISAGTLKQQITMMGGDMERSAGFLTKASNADQIVAWCYADINLGVCRVSYDKKQELVEGTPNFAFYDNAVIAMQKVKAVKPSVQFWSTLKTDYDGYGTENNMPDWVYTGGGYNGGTYDPTKFNATKYARFLADYLKYMNSKGVPITYLSVSKEWTQVMTADNEKNAIVALNSLLATAAYSGVPKPKYIGPATWGVGGATTFLTDVKNKNYGSYYEGFSTHQYDNPTQAKWQSFVSLANGMGKKAYDDESSAGAGGPTDGVEVDMSVPTSTYAAKCDSYAGGLQGEVFFELWSRGINRETRAVYFTNGGAGVRMRGYYIMKHFANNVVNKNYIASSSANVAGVKTMAFLSGTKAVVFVINPTDTAYSGVTFTVNGKTISSTSISRRAWYTGSNLDGQVTSIARQTTNTFVANAGNKSVVMYTFDVQ